MSNIIDTKLADIKAAILKGQTEYSTGGEDHLKWMYYCLINDIQTGLWSSSETAIDLDDSSRAHYLYKNYPDIPPSLNEWIAKYCVKDKDGDFCPFGNETQTGVVSRNLNANFLWFKPDNYAKANAIYEFHKRAIETYEKAKKIPIQTVHDFLESPKWPDKKTSLRTTKPIPSINELIAALQSPQLIDADEAQRQASEVHPNDYQTVHDYAKDMGIMVRKAVALVSHFTVTACPSPHQTIDAVEQILELRAAIPKTTLDGMMIQNRTGVAGWIDGITGRVRLLPFEETPIFEIVQIAQTLPDSALADSKLHADHVKVLQKGLEIIHAYDDALRHYIDALEARQTELKVQSPEGSNTGNDIISTRDIASAILTDSVADKLDSLRLSRQFARAHAGNFATTMRVILQSKAEKEQIAGLGANILLPLQQAQRAFIAYQSKKFGQVSGVVNDLIGGTSDEGGLSNPHQSQQLFIQSIDTLSTIIERMRGDLQTSNQVITEISSKTEAAVAQGEARSISHAP